MNKKSNRQILLIELDQDNRIIQANIRAQKWLAEHNVPFDEPFDFESLLGISADEDLSFFSSKINLFNIPHFIQIFSLHQGYCIMAEPISLLKNKLALFNSYDKYAFDHFTAKSEKMSLLIEQAKVFSREREPILIRGETGVGKDMMAIACHQYSSRAKNPFLGLNCAAMPEEVVETELFGYAPGVLPNGAKGKKGFFEQADTGTVLLDGIDEMSMKMQTKLIRFINDGAFRRVGDDNEVHVDVRIICATKRDLQELVKEGKFREDLYYRLNVFSLVIPPLRERKEDIIPLSDAFLTAFAKKHNRNKIKIPTSLQKKLVDYYWAGNVRELKNRLFSAFAQHKPYENFDLELPVVVPPEQSDFIKNLDQFIVGKSLDEMSKAFERTILDTLYQTYPSSRKLAQRLGLSHTAIANKLKEYQIIQHQSKSTPPDLK